MFRGLLGLVAVGLLVLVVQRAATSHSADADWLKLTEGHGRTAQGAAVEMRFDGTAIRFHRSGRGLRVVEISDKRYDDGTFGQIVFSMRATLGPGAKQVRGWVRLTAGFSHDDGASTACDSGRVAFAIDAPLASTRATSARPS
jgi:hypothetical protein